MESSGSPLKDILKTSLPAVVDLSSQTLMWTAEAIMIGKISASAFAGVGMAIQIIILFFAVLLTFVVGSSVIINRHLGAKNYWEANHVLGQALMIGIVMSVMTALVWYFGATLLFKLIRESEPIAQQSGVLYIRIIALFAPLILTNFIAMGILRAAGETRVSMTLNLIINFLNLFLAAILIFGLFGFPRLEVKGAALAVGISHSVGTFCTLYVLRSRKVKLFLSFRELTTPNFRTFERLFKTGLPTTVEQLCWAFGQMVMTGYAAVLGIVFLAAHQVFMRIQAVLTMVFTGFSLAAMTLVGQNIGAREHKRAEQTGRMASYVVLGFVLLIVASIFLFSEPLIALFTSEDAVVQTGAGILRLFALIQIPKALNAVLSGNLRGAGDLKWLMYLAIFSVIVSETIFAWVAAFPLGLSLWGIWLVMGLDEVLRLVLNYLRFHSGKWKFIQI
jgi:putative MATE family efflux protein